MKKFLCDQMCSNLGKWLRIAGYDTVIIITPFKDREIFEIAVKEKRLLLTRDRHFLKIDPAGHTVVYLKKEFLEEWAKQLKEERIVNWMYHPLSRCLNCNSLLEKIDPSVNFDQVHMHIKEFWYCSVCDQLFWFGSHAKRMLSKLKVWNLHA